MNPLEVGKSCFYTFFGFLSDYQDAYQTNIIIEDLGAPTSNIFLKNTSFLLLAFVNINNLNFVVPIEYIPSNYQENNLTNTTQGKSEEMPRKTSIIVIIVYGGVVLSLILLYLIVVCFFK